eukprot:CAMPEP_0113239710 /NCGR_PEP_ID=MMETSP0008_2-20120614/5868_1 /TAXON_ID=97485 /ORGANISM="Prymnesium parvum" /LENGTH=31 /DNA_ID=CAMNT_0000086989 /DNA_START=319 /DNA_END=414 /DNA_ORIENTATION=- /assembly_acc=CAM_ASM_000153
MSSGFKVLFEYQIEMVVNNAAGSWHTTYAAR